MNNVSKTGPIAWMASHPVAANLLMAIFVLGGFFIATKVKQEVFPEVEIDLVSIAVPYPGASPAEVEQGIVLSIEEAVRGLDDIKRVTATAAEGLGTVAAELMDGANSNKVLQDIKNGVDRITSFPQEAERPVVQLLTNRRSVISLILYGPLEERVLREEAERIRTRLLDESDITTVELSGVRPFEISIEVPQNTLRAYDLTLAQIGEKVRRGAIELPGGGVKTPSGEILLRTAERRDFGKEFHDLAIVSRPDGTHLTLGEIATIRDTFRDTDQSASFNGLPAVEIRVFRVGNQKPIDIAEKAKRIAEEMNRTLPQGVAVATWNDVSEMYRDRVHLLIKNAALGLVLVLLILGIFLEIRLAFWVTMGIPISVLGAFLIFPTYDVSINMISLFAFIVTLGIIVDDAVVVGENIHEWRQRGLSRVDAAIAGAKQVSVPVCFSILTNIAAFMPMLFVPGMMGKFFRVIPIITISVFIVSLLESLYVLPAHLAHQSSRQKDYRSTLRRGQARFNHLLQSFIQSKYRPFLRVCLAHRYLTASLGIALFALTTSLIPAGRIAYTFMPKVDTDLVVVNVELPFGSPIEQTKAVTTRMANSARQALDDFEGEHLRGLLINHGSSFNERGPSTNGSHLAAVFVYLTPSEARDFGATQFVKQWRKHLGDVPGVEALRFQYSTGPSSGKAIDIELSHTDIDTLEHAAADLAESLRSYVGVKDIDDGFALGKPQYDLKIKPEAQQFGLTATDLGSQVRHAFYGMRALRQQRGREEIWVMVRYPEEERQARTDIKKLLIRTPQGGEIPITEAAVIEEGRSYTSIQRRDGKRVVNVTADVNQGEANANQVLQDVTVQTLGDLVAKYPGLSYAFEGEQRQQRETSVSLIWGSLLALLVIYAMLAIPFGSYLHPFVVLAAIPFGFVGALLGHVVMGYDLSMISMMGIVALGGVVVNDSLVLIYAAKGYRGEGMSAFQAIMRAGSRRFRPILLTSLTTFFGLAPMIFETSVQAKFLIPMAISLGFGILFATFLVLLLVPALYLIVEDIYQLLGWTSVEPSIESPTEHPVLNQG